MNSDKYSAIILAITIVAVTLIWSKTEITKTKTLGAAQEESSRYTIDSGAKMTPPLLLDKKTGRVWRYYRNDDKTGALINEGFTILHAEE